MYFPWSVTLGLGGEDESSRRLRRMMTTTTTTAGVTAADGGGGAPAASPPILNTLPPQNGHRILPMGSRPSAGEENTTSPATIVDQQSTRPPFLIDIAIRCTVPSCSCECFSPCKSQIRTCDGCGHGWVSHALEKLGFRHLFNCHQVELVKPSIAFDVASLMLYGTQAIPVRLKILLDRLFSVLRQDEVLQVLHGFGWTNEDYSRGYIVQDASGRVLEKWLMATREEEPLILQQFLRFGETKPIAQQLLLHDSYERPELVVNTPRTESDIKKFIERTSRPVGSSSSAKQNTQVQAAPVSNTLTKPTFRQPTPSVSSTHSMSPSAVSPVNNCSSSLSLSPLNRLQNMQPCDYRRERSASEPRTSESLNVSSAIYSSPSSSPGTSTLAVSTSSATSVAPISSIPRYNPGSSDFSGGEEIGVSDDEDSSSAINLTRSSVTSGYLDSIFAAKKIRHLRKSANPMKRRWNPMVLSTLATNPSTGKKRVQCHVCLKTFCDKGALKIHFSAVHLREMHKCSVDGCNMMFSSRRSRNRHSANPNPKLHTPNFRRKLNPHDGRSANPYPLVPPTGIHGYNGSMLSGTMNNHYDGDSNSVSDTEAPQTSFMKCLDYQLSPKEEKFHSTGDERKEIKVQSEEKVEDMPLSLIKKRRMDDEQTPKEEANTDEQGGIDLTVKDDRISSISKGVRKRKSLNPTKCRVNSDDDLQYVSTDDSSSDTYIDQDNGENGHLDSKSDCLSSDGLDSKDDDDDDDLDVAEFESIKTERVSRLSPPPPSHCPPNVNTSAINVSTTPTLNNFPKYFGEKQNGFVNREIDLLKKEVLRNKIQQMEDISENPLRHLESLSLGSFASMMNTSRNNFNRNSIHNSSGVSYHAPGLGLGSSVITTTAPIRADSPPVPQTADHINHLFNHTSAIVSPPSSQQLSGGHANSDPESSLQDQQMPLLPVYRDASIVGAVDIPVDKENPRRCCACGKIFQNHFGVKTHYQNVHLKLMHKCTVEGCNAAFPSKRSRDRHSANLNLHRKLLSTSSDKSPSFFDKGAIYPYPPDATLRGDFFSRLYDPQTLPLSFTELYHSRISAEGGFLAGSQYPGHLIPSFHPALIFPPTTNASHSRRHTNDDMGSGRDSPISSSGSADYSPQPRQNSPQREPSIKLEEDLRPDGEGRYACDICEKKFHESIVLREHYEKCHSSSLLKCVEDGCNKVFLSGRTRNLHTDELHKSQIIEAS